MRTRLLESLHEAQAERDRLQGQVDVLAEKESLLDLKQKVLEQRERQLREKERLVTEMQAGLQSQTESLSMTRIAQEDGFVLL